MITSSTAISTKTSNFPTFADGHYEMQLCEAIERSARGRAWVKVDKGGRRELDLHRRVTRKYTRTGRRTYNEWLRHRRPRPRRNRADRRGDHGRWAATPSAAARPSPRPEHRRPEQPVRCPIRGPLPMITTMNPQSVPLNGEIQVFFTVHGSAISNALQVTASSSELGVVPLSGLTVVQPNLNGDMSVRITRTMHPDRPSSASTSAIRRHSASR